MTKKHFIAMAREFKEALDNAKGEDVRAGVILGVEGFMRVAEGINPRFDHARFKTACGFDGWSECDG